MTLAIGPLEIDHVLINMLAGSVPIFIGLAMITIAVLAARFRMPGSVFAMILIAFFILMAGTGITGGIVTAGLILILTGIVYVVGKQIARGFGG